MAPIQAIWAKDNRGVMVRVLGEPGDPSTHLENRIGEPLANPYLYMASQIHAGLDGIARKLDPGPSADTPYETAGRADAEVARRGARRAEGQRLLSRRLRRRLSSIIYSRIKEAEIARCDAESGGQSGNSADVTAWEHKEYFDLA